MIKRSINDQEAILLRAAAKGLNSFFDTIRGAHLFGAGAKAVAYRDHIVVKTRDGETYIHTSTGLLGYKEFEETRRADES
jgi:hypothetical protein